MGFAVLSVVAVVAILVMRSPLPYGEVNALLITPLCGLYLGWFHRPGPARAFGIGLILVLVCAVFWSGYSHTEFSAAVAAGHAVFITGFAFEAASALRRRLERQAVLDPLTQVLNRRGLLAHSRPMIAAAEAGGAPITLALIDFDDFKAVNDGGGHLAGDAALRNAAFSWVEALGEDGLIARVGGDEFVLLLHGDRESADGRLTAIRRQSEHSWSWGLAQFRPGDTLDDLMKRADRRMYRAKDEREG